jgi:hypothetical protein
MNKQELLQRIGEICYNAEDTFSLDEWSSVTVAQLRTVVALLDDGGAREIVGNASPRQIRGHCFLLEGLMTYLGDPRATNPHTRRPITERQRDLVRNAYMRVLEHTLDKSDCEEAPRPSSHWNKIADDKEAFNAFKHSVERSLKKYLSENEKRFRVIHIDPRRDDNPNTISNGFSPLFTAGEPVSIDETYPGSPTSPLMDQLYAETDFYTSLRKDTVCVLKGEEQIRLIFFDKSVNGSPDSNHPPSVQRTLRRQRVKRLRSFLESVCRLKAQRRKQAVLFPIFFDLVEQLNVDGEHVEFLAKAKAHGIYPRRGVFAMLYSKELREKLREGFRHDVRLLKARQESP